MALCAQSEEDADYFQNMAETLHGYNMKVSPITELSKVSFLLVARAGNGDYDDSVSDRSWSMERADRPRQPGAGGAVPR